MGWTRDVGRGENRNSIKYSYIPSTNRWKPDIPCIIRIGVYQGCGRAANYIGSQINNTRIHFKNHFQIFVDAYSNFHIRVNEMAIDNVWSLLVAG